MVQTSKTAYWAMSKLLMFIYGPDNYVFYNKKTTTGICPNQELRQEDIRTLKGYCIVNSMTRSGRYFNKEE